MTGYYSETGMAMMDAGGPTIADVAVNQYPPRSFETTMEMTPERPNVDWKPGRVVINWSQPSLRFNWKTHQSPTTRYVPYQMNTNVTRYYKLDIKYVGTPADLQKTPPYRYG